MTICRQYSTHFERDEPLGSILDLCQDCWEADCSAAWWKIVNAIAQQQPEAEERCL
jgi:hypothetical protein